MRVPLDLYGKRFGRLIALARVESTRSPSGSINVIWLCRCDCGTTVKVSRRNLRSGNSTSCGCLHREITIRRSTVHGEASTRRGHTPEYNCWANMIRRCEKVDGQDWHLYGGRGIGVCARWRASFTSFLADMGRRPSSRHSIDRVDADGHYEPGNCRWATPSEQRRNQRPPNEATLTAWQTNAAKARSARRLKHQHQP